MVLKEKISQTALWLSATAIVAAVIMVFIYTNRTLSSIEENLPGTLLSELSGITSVSEDLSKVVSAIYVEKASPAEENMKALRKTIDVAYESTVRLRETYVINNLVNASAFHSIVAPALADLKIWADKGVSGYASDSAITLSIMERRLADVMENVSRVNDDSRRQAQAILEAQRDRLSNFLNSVNMLFALTFLSILFLVYLMIRQTHFRKRENLVQEALRRQHDILDSLLDNLPLGVIVWDKNAQNIHMNKSVTEITGYTAEDVPSPEHWAGLAYPDPVYRNQVKTHWRQQTKKGEPSEYRVTCMDGTVKDIEFAATFLPEGTVIDTLTDVTDRNQNEKALAEVRKIRIQAKKMESLGLLAGGVAHDLNNILSGIVSYPDLILLDLPEEGKITKAIQLMRDSGIKATAIVQDLLTVARGVAISKEPLNLNTIIEEYMRSPDFECVLKFHDKVRVEVLLAGDLHNIMGSRVHLRKILMNLVSNGCEAIEEAGAVRISTENVCIDGPLHGYKEVEPGDYVVLRVVDQGKGISAADRERIFEPFYSKKVMGRSGTGLGLTVVWNVVQDHNGYINVATSEEGTQFAVYLPATQQLLPVPENVFDMDKYSGRGETILIVDDVSSQRQITVRILEKLGYRTAVAANGEEAVEFVKKQRVDLILLDMIMDPGINGRETFRRIRQIVPDQKAIIVSGFAETKDVKEALRLGAGRFLKKPFMMHELATSVRNVLDG